MINKSNIGEVSIEEKGFKLTIKQKEDAVQQIITGGARSCMLNHTATLPPAQQSGLQVSCRCYLRLNKSKADRSGNTII